MSDDTEDFALHIDGQAYAVEDLSFREQRTMRDIVRGLAPENDPDQAAEADIIPALITVIKRREQPDYRVEDALEFKPSDLRPPTAPAEG